MNAATLMLRDLHIFQQEFAFLPSPEVFSRNFSQTTFQSRLISCSTHYLAESLSWYSLEREKHSWTPPSVQSRCMPASSSSEKGSVSSMRDTTSITILASLCKGNGKLRNGLPDGWQKWRVAGCHNIIKYESVRHCQGAWQISLALRLILGGASKIEKVALPRQPHLLPIPITCQLPIRL